MKDKISITTRGGDKGRSSLYSGERMPKDSPRFAAIGDVDELGTILGVAKLYAKKEDVVSAITAMQNDLFVLNSQLATTPEHIGNLKRLVDGDMLSELDRRCAALEAKVDLPATFVLAGESLGSAYLDFAKAVARRCERRIVALSSEGFIAGDGVLPWINRLSDYLFLLARYEGGTPTPVRR